MSNGSQFLIFIFTFVTLPGRCFTKLCDYSHTTGFLFTESVYSNHEQFAVNSSQVALLLVHTNILIEHPRSSSSWCHAKPYQHSSLTFYLSNWYHNYFVLCNIHLLAGLLLHVSMIYALGQIRWNCSNHLSCRTDARLLIGHEARVDRIISTSGMSWASFLNCNSSSYLNHIKVIISSMFLGFRGLPPLSHTLSMPDTKTVPLDQLTS